MWTDYNSELLARIFDNPKIQQEHVASYGISVIGGEEPTLQEDIEELEEDIRGESNKLLSIQKRLPLIDEAPSVKTALTAPIMRTATDRSKVFLVHGHDDLALQTTARFLEKIGLEAIILSEQPNAGRTIIEKLEDHADVAFAVVLLTPDDVGASKAKPADLRDRARQNVILELGYFFGRLGRGHVAALYQGDMELPSDVHGFLYTAFDSNGAWKLLLAREMKAAGMDVDINKAV